MAIVPLLVPAQTATPQGKLISYEEQYFTQSGRKLVDASAHAGKDGHVGVTYYNYYEDFDTLSVETQATALDTIAQLIRNDLPALTAEAAPPSDSPADRLTLIFDTGDTLRHFGSNPLQSMMKVRQFVRRHAVAQKRLQPLKKLSGPIPTDQRWLNGVRWSDYEPRKGYATTRYQWCNQEILVTRHARSGQVTDIWIAFDGGSDEIDRLHETLLRGIYQNATGYAAFGSQDFEPRDYFADDDYTRHDPGEEIFFKHSIGPKGIVYNDTIEWGSKRIQQVNAPAGAPPGWGGSGAFSGPSVWKVNFEGSALHVQELHAAHNAPTSPAFGKDFKLKRVRGPYAHTSDPWAIAAQEPLTRGQLKLLTPQLLREILAEMKRRHADGSALWPMERLNQSLIQTLLAEQNARPARKKTHK